MTCKAVTLALIVSGTLACVTLPGEHLVRIGCVALLLLGSWLILRACIVGVAWESRPRVWRYQGGVVPGWGPEERRRLAELRAGVR